MLMVGWVGMRRWDKLEVGIFFSWLQKKNHQPFPAKRNRADECFAFSRISFSFRLEGVLL